MTLHIFNDNTGVIFGADSARIRSTVIGALSIAGKVIELRCEEPVNLPAINDGVHVAKFTADNGTVYTLGSYNVRGGNIIPRQDLTAEEINLRHRVDALEESLAELSKTTAEEIYNLKHMFDTDALNFLFK